ncbi:choice-of-anchor D domain-containing protein [Acidicapsa ligni]|uniref:choice-of-anchor D domain-containing protein n=1 Tax=Acidicapsa ligni TaxID=542300 RepID=UPI0021E0257B|nr:choice-of-anchor D domain-containing protein [Acidicapsa ligni]
MSLDLRLRQSPRVSMTASILVLLTLLSIGVAKAATLPQTATHRAVQAQAQATTQAQPKSRSQSAAVPSHDQIRQTLLRQPLYFEPAADGAMTRRSPAGTMRLDAAGKAQFSAPGKTAISMVLDGARTAAKPTGEETLPGRSNYLLGNDPALWRTGVSQFSRVRVPAVYPGIDLVYYGNGNQLEHDYQLAPNADPSLIRMRFQGAATVNDDSTGDLILRQTASTGTPNEALRLLKPVAYQQAANGAKTPIPVRYRPLADGGYGFALGVYDHRQAVVIDPVIVYGSYFGGKFNDSIVDLKVGSDGSLYLLLTTDSTDLKTVGATTGACVGECGPANADAGAFTQPDMYIAKLDSTFQTLLFATYLGGSDNDQAYNLALDTDGSVYVAGATHSTNFPIVNGYPGGTPVVGGKPSGTLTKLSADGSTILYSTFIGYGSPSASFAPPVMVTANNGIVYLIGQSDVADLNFIWQKNPLFMLGQDFLAKLDTTKTGTDSVVYATCVGDSVDGTKVAQLASLALDSKGDVWLYGQTSDNTFPVATANALEPQCRSTPCVASFLMEIDPTGASIPYATYLGGTNGASDTVVTPRDIVIDPSDNIYVSGYTNQGDFPTLNGYSLAIDGYYAGYASKLSPDGTTLLYSTFLPVSAEIAVSTKGQLAFTGVAGSGFPVQNNLQTMPIGANNYDAVFGLIDTTQSFDNSLLISSYLGTTTGTTLPQRVYLADTGQILIVGETNATDVPIANAYQPASGGGATDGFIAAIQSSSLTLTPTTITFPATSVGSTSAAMTATLLNGTTQSIYLIQSTLTDSKDFTQSDNCNGILSPQASCTVTFTFKPQTSGTLTSTYTTGDLDNPATRLTITLTGTANAAAATLSPTTLAFGSVTDGTSVTQSVTLTNSSSAALPITSAVVTGTGFSLTSNGCGASIAAGATCQFGITASPTAESPYTGTLTVTDSLGTQIVQLTATGAQAKGSETLLPATVNFGNVYDSTTAQQVVTFTNNGPGAVTFSAATITGQVFHIVTTTCITQPVAAGSSCTYTLSFIPFAVGTVQGTFTVTDGSSNPSVALTGTGIQPPTADDVRLSPSAVNFQNVVLGQGSSSSPEQQLTFANQTSQTIEVLGTQRIIAGAGSSFFNQQVGQPFFCPISTDGHANITLAPNTSCIIDIVFDPTGISTPDTTYNAQFQLSWTYSGDTQLHYLATALTANTLSPPTPVVSPTSLQFPATANGVTSAAQIVNVTNQGDSPFAIAGISINGTNPTAFTQTNNCPANLNKNGNCQISVYFKPLATGNEFSANLQIVLNTGTENVTLSGGTNPSDFVLSSASPSQGGSNPTWAIDVAPLTASIGFHQPITFKVTGLDPSYGTPVFTPSTVTPNGGTVSTTMTLSQPTPAALNRKPFSGTTTLPVLACCMAFFLGFRKKLKNYRVRIAAILIVVALATSALLGCSSSKPAVVFTVTATSGNISHNLTLTLQP